MNLHAASKKIIPHTLVKPERNITGMSAILLPFLDDQSIDWNGFDGHVARTVAAGLIPAVNMDTGYVNLITDTARRDVLQHTRDIVSGGKFVAGAYVGDQPGAAWNPTAYSREMEVIQNHGGIPVIFQSYGLTGNSGQQIVDCYRELCNACDTFIAFELGTMFAPFGRIYDLDTYAGIMRMPQCIGAKHSSLSRELEWQRLLLRDKNRPDFMVLTGNDLAIDMVMYGSDYLLGLSTFAPEAFARRDRYWAEGDARFYELNDVLQYLGHFAFRPPVPAYKHSAAQFLKLRGWIKTDLTHPQSASRPASDAEVLEKIMATLRELMS